LIKWNWAGRIALTKDLELELTLPAHPKTRPWRVFGFKKAKNLARGRSFADFRMEPFRVALTVLILANSKEVVNPMVEF